MPGPTLGAGSIASPGDTIVSAAAELLCSGEWVAQR